MNGPYLNWVVDSAGIKKQAGKLFGDHTMEGEGAVRQAKGDAKKAANS